MNFQALILIIFIGFLWGTSTNSIRFCIQMIDPLTFLGLRYTIVAFLYLVVSLIHIAGKSLPKDKVIWKNGMIFCIFGDVIPITLYAFSLNYQSSGISAILASLYPVMTVLFAHFLLPDEKLNRVKGFGLLCSIGGIALLALRGESGLPDIQKVDLTGYLLVFFSAVVSSAFAIYIRKRMVSFDAWSITSARFISAALITLPISLIFSGFNLSRLTTQGYIVFGYSSIVVFVGYFVAFLIIQKHGATTYSLADFVTPISATLIGWLFLSERISELIAIGMIMIFCGLILLNINFKKKISPDLKLGVVE
jgi:drug/metabolite transporter (DMT)-like permease